MLQWYIDQSHGLWIEPNILNIKNIGPSYKYKVLNVNKLRYA